MAVDFPTSPSNGQTFTSGTITYTYNSTASLWNSASSGGGGSSVTVSDTAPTSPSDGDMWYNSLDLNLYVYYNDGSSSQWVQSAPQQSGVAGADGDVGAAGAAGSATSYANLAAFPSSGNTAGDMGVATDTKSSYMWDGVAWQRLAMGPQIGPRFTTTPAAEHDLNNDGSTATTITGIAVDESGFPITYDWDAFSGATVYNAASLPPQLTSVTQSSAGVFSFVANASAAAGTFKFRSKASDGVLFTPAISTVSLSFYPQAASLFGKWDFGDAASYSGTGTTWSDLSGNSNDIAWQNVTASTGYNASGALGIPVWETGLFGTHFNNLDWSTSKTTMIIFQPDQAENASNWRSIFIGLTAGGSAYGGYFGTNGSFMQNVPTFSGLTAAAYVNGNLVTTPAQANAALEWDKMNSVAIVNYVLAFNGNNAPWFRYYTGYNDTLQLRAMAAWSASLSLSELETAHNTYPQMATWDG